MQTQPTQQQLLALWDAVQRIESEVNYEDPKGMFDHMNDFIGLLSMVTSEDKGEGRYEVGFKQGQKCIESYEIFAGLEYTFNWAKPELAEHKKKYPNATCYIYNINTDETVLEF